MSVFVVSSEAAAQAIQVAGALDISSRHVCVNSNSLWLVQLHATVTGRQL